MRRDEERKERDTAKDRETSELKAEVDLLKRKLDEFKDDIKRAE
jgi:hypothetical protein